MFSNYSAYQSIDNEAQTLLKTLRDEKVPTKVTNTNLHQVSFTLHYFPHGSTTCSSNIFPST